ncbi:hypothetical protein ESY86_11200 [Subsaximicrobium wynnwilliamsii]|uniref:DUF4382 domain-containing protein n=1 Tax=Subsaximicrobium wynnwilliamsii TaxID=291179 RepID=A0A5C6ZFF5_9FLAO|nr:hypothetical protein [Subsaximicrobium wynnwilliamsii]TXD83054.1 hypothetical protein ESY87_11235 [Subsaximicrobium wynnwilliamsii]TXD88798.1 hypothetical protein ESY86_11200 [Subsaximicrobium wynnwilliamsii]TXE02871.1 hypothetical protein ESY88_10255 [Subsaximicrobium wynnwilliamsii]
MKLSNLLPVLMLALFTMACSSSDDQAPLVINEVEGLIKIQEISNSTHTIELFNKSGLFETGFNDISLRLKDKVTDAYIEEASISWMPMMQMPSMQHSCPKSAISKVAGKATLYQGNIIYQMTNTDGSGWSLDLNYTLDGVDYMASDTISVFQSESQNVSSFTGSDDMRYVLALIAPEKPIIGINPMEVGLYKMESMMAFPAVPDYTIKLDPRMPGMGNHSSPNNTDLIFQLADASYQGNLSLTMTGYWVLNLKLINAAGELLKGKDVTVENTQSSLYLELEF